MRPQPHPLFTRDDVTAFVTAARRAAQTTDPGTRDTVEVALRLIAEELQQDQPRWDATRRWALMAKRELAWVANPAAMMPLLQMPWP